MTSEQEWHSAEGDHKLPTIVTSGDSITFTMNSSLVATDDTATLKYFNNVARSVAQFNMVPDKAVQITHINGVALTDAIPVAANAVYAEDRGFYKSITVKSTADNTVVSMRVR